MKTVFKKLELLLEKIFTRTETKVDERRKRIFIALTMIITVPAIFIYGLMDMFQGRFEEGIVVIAAAVFLSSSLVVLRFSQKIVPVYRVMASITLLLMMYELGVGGGEGYAFIWFYLFPVSVFFLFGSMEGMFWTWASMIIATTLFYVGIGSQLYTIDVVSRYIVTYSIVSVLSYALESSRNRLFNELLNDKQDLEAALKQVKTLKGLLPICSGCKKIRDDSGYWKQLEHYISHHSDAQFSHSICPECIEILYPGLCDSDESIQNTS